MSSRYQNRALKLLEGSLIPDSFTLQFIQNQRLLKMQAQSDYPSLPSHQQNQGVQRLKFNKLIAMYGEEYERIVLWYTFPQAEMGLEAGEKDPVLLSEKLKSRYSDKSTLFIGVSHRFPSYLARLQASIELQFSQKEASQNIKQSRSVIRKKKVLPKVQGFRKTESKVDDDQEKIEPKSQQRHEQISDEQLEDSRDKNETKFKVMLVADPDFELYKQISWDMKQEIWIKPIKQKSQDQDSFNENWIGQVEYNSKQNKRIFINNFLSIGISASIMIYIGCLYNEMNQ